MTGSSDHISFNESTLPLADRVMIFCLNTQEMQIDTLFDGTVEEVLCLLSPSGSGRLDLALSKLRKPVNIDLTKLKVVASASLEGYVINELENGSIQAFENGNGVDVVLPVLRRLAASLGLPIANDNGNPYNTRSLGTMVIKAANGKASG